jgi:hypothetical protein
MFAKLMSPNRQIHRQQPMALLADGRGGSDPGEYLYFPGMMKMPCHFIMPLRQQVFAAIR